jgi:hypothetical protein
MKYQTITKHLKKSSNYNTTGFDRLSVTPTDRPALAEFRARAIENGDLDRYWGPYDLTVDDGDLYLRTSIVWNTLDGAYGWWLLVVDPSDVPKASDVYYCKIVQIDDNGNVTSVIKESTDITPDANPT